jgi:chromosome segregation ATPase
MAGINLIKLFGRSKTARPPPIVLDQSSEAPEVEENPEASGATLQALANAIQKAAVDLGRLDEIRLALESLKEPIANEFENRVIDASRLAQINSELKTTRGRLAETEETLERAKARLGDLDKQIGDLNGQLDRAGVSLSAATEALDRLRPDHQEALATIEELRTHIIAYSGEVFDLQTERESLIRQLESSEAARSNGEALLAQMREAGVEMEARAQGTLKRLEQATAENVALERVIGELKLLNAGEQDRSAELSSQLAASRAEARLAGETMKEQAELDRAEIQDLRGQLEETLSRTQQVQKLHQELVIDQSTAGEEKSRLQRDLATTQAENRQLAQRVEVLDSWVADWRRRFADVDGARLAADERAEQLQLALAQSEASVKRGESLIEQKSLQLIEAFRAKDIEQGRMRAEIAELKSLLSQGRAELAMRALVTKG